MRAPQGSSTTAITLEERIKRWTYDLTMAGWSPERIGNLSLEYLRMLDEERERRVAIRDSFVAKHGVKPGHQIRYAFNLGDIV